MSIPVEVSSEAKWDWPLQANDQFVKIIDDETHFEVDLDAKCFTPKEIELNTEDYFTKYKQKMIHALAASSCYKLPAGVNPKTLKSSLDNNGVLHISAQKGE
ncbi:unnamed protein product [Nippostrongylus brasiliensis]|uniref:SHSP domain-containing protein n=1 Tax=Nippostrongylus brasiliensis TaxID=27835 RepID=A0A158R0X8_NIPBR|nr:unnamed protein product [Nippostrongylus brasiliensis]